MKTANKVIDDRIVILDSFLEKTKDSTEPGVQMNRGNALHAKGLFGQLKLAIQEHTNLLNVGVDNEDLTEKIKELAGQTMVPLVERNKQMVDSYKQMIFNLHQRGEEIKKIGREDIKKIGNVELKAELNGIEETMIQYDIAKKETKDYLEEYETALEEIKEFVISKEVDEIAEIIEENETVEENETDADGLNPVNPEKVFKSDIEPKNDDNNGEFPV